MKSNELKIDLYPDNKPISELEKLSIKNFINKETLGYSFDLNQKLGYLCYKAPLLSGLYKAYSNHYPFRIKPDDIWLLIVQCFSYHVNVNSEKLRTFFVDFEGKKDLIVKFGGVKIEKEHLETFVENINEQLKEYLGKEIIDNLTPDFTTTDINMKFVCQISIMDSFKNYFNYIFDNCECGIPYIILEGEAEDYKKIISKAKNLCKYDFDWYIKRIIPIIQKMVDAKEGKIDIDFFKNIILKNEIKEKNKKYGNPCIIRKYKEEIWEIYKKKYIDGWILKFFGYIKDEDGKLSYFSGNKIEGDEINNLPNQILNVPFKLIEKNGEIKDMIIEAGIFGCIQNEKKEVSLGIGWLVKPSTSSKEYYKTDEQFLQFRREYLGSERYHK